MTQFFPVEPSQRIWQVVDLLTAEQVADIQRIDWMQKPWHRGSGQEHWQRRSIDYQDSDVQRVSGYITDCLDKINLALGQNFKHTGGQFWLDEPGFTVPMHTDGHLPATMQIYWLSIDDSYGTGFYQYRSQDSLLYQFKSQPNTGYIMLNHLNDDGSQPLYWHGMFRPVPIGTFRLSSYWYLNQ